MLHVLTPKRCRGGGSMPRRKMEKYVARRDRQGARACGNFFAASAVPPRQTQKRSLAGTAFCGTLVRKSTRMMAKPPRRRLTQGPQRLWFGQYRARQKTRMHFLREATP